MVAGNRLKRFNKQKGESRKKENYEERSMIETDLKNAKRNVTQFNR